MIHTSTTCLEAESTNSYNPDPPCSRAIMSGDSCAKGLKQVLLNASKCVFVKQI
jgi:hypothetical protein